MTDAEFGTLAPHAGLTREQVAACQSMQQAAQAQGRRLTLLEAALAGGALSPQQQRYYQAWDVELARRRALASSSSILTASTVDALRAMTDEPAVAPTTNPEPATPTSRPEPTAQTSSPEPAEQKRRTSSHRLRALSASQRLQALGTPASTRGSRRTALAAAAAVGVALAAVGGAVALRARRTPVAAAAPTGHTAAVSSARPAPPVATPEPEPVEQEEDPRAEVARLREDLARTTGPARTPVLERLAELLAALHGPASPALAAVYAELIEQHELVLGDLEGALGYGERLRPLLEGAPARSLELHLLTARRARLLASAGRLDEALAELDRADEAQRRALGPEHPQLGVTLRARAHLERTRGATSASRQALERAIELLARSDAPLLVEQLREARNDLAAALLAEGEVERARGLLDDNLTQLEQAGARGPALLACLRSLGLVRRRLGLTYEARDALLRALGLCERLGLEASWEGALSRELGSVLLEMGLQQEALTLLRRAEAVTRRVNGAGSAEHVEACVELSRALPAQDAVTLLESVRARPTRSHRVELASRYLEVERAGEALPVLDGAVQELEAQLGPRSLDLARSLTLRATALMAVGRLADARRDVERARSIQEGALDERHADRQESDTALAFVLARQGERAQATARMRRVVGLTVTSMVEVMGALAPRERLAAATRQQRVLADWLELCRLTGETGYREVLALEGLVGRFDAHVRRRLDQPSQPPELRALREQLRTAQRRLAAVFHARAAASGERAAALHDELLRVERRCQQLGRQLMNRAQELVGPASAFVEQDVPPLRGWWLVDYVRDASRYVAFVVPPAYPREPARRVELADRRAVDAAVEHFRRALLDPNRESEGALASVGRSLRALVWDPLGLPADARRVYLVPAGALAALPFAALPAPAGREGYLGEHHDLAHLATAQDLATPTAPPRWGEGLLGVGGIDYDHASAQDAASLAAPPLAPPSLYFGPLVGAAEEVHGCAELYAEAHEQASVLLEGASATEEALRRQVQGKRVVHLATHGFVRLDLPAALATASRGRALSERSVGFDPMLLSGLALAGANTGVGGDGHDGILTALEASHVDLAGVELVVLSACDTARGSAEAGEGVVGLVRGFSQAGAMNVVASLWPVSDLAACVFMEDLHRRAWERDARGARARSLAAALRETAQATRALEVEVEEVRARPFDDPRFWAAFVVYGPVDGYDR